MTIKSKHFAWLALTLVACGGGTPKPAAPPPAPKTPPPPVASVAEPEPAPEPPDAGAKEQPQEETPPPKPHHGPTAMFNDSTQPQTVGYDGAEFTLSAGAILDIPADSLRNARNILFTVDKKARFRKFKGKLGPLFMLSVQVPGKKFVMGASRESNPVASYGDPFVLKLTLPKGTDKANLAIESLKPGAKGHTKSSWRVIPMTKLETSDDGNRAVFHIRELPDAHVYLTTQDPTDAPSDQ